MSPDAFQSWLALAPDRRPPLVMGILNVTPDSFSDGGQAATAEAIGRRISLMIDEGADLIDVGGESTRPGAQPVDGATQIARVRPALLELQRRGAAASIDTTRSAVAAAALDCGAVLVNDTSAGLADAGLLPACAARGAAVCLMHARGTPATMQSLTHYDDLLADVRSHLLARADAAVAAGVGRGRVLVDPGIGFAKTAGQNLLLLRHLDRLTRLGYSLLLGTSRKKFIGDITAEPAAADRIFGTAATVALGIAAGAAVVRVHDVRAMRQVMQMTAAIIAAG